MIAINDTTSFSGLDFEQNNGLRLIPNSFEINLLIPNNSFVNTAITTVFKNLLVDISNSCSGLIVSVSENVKTRASQMFNTIGFYKNSSGTIQFMLNVNALDQGTSMIINSLHDIINYNDKAYNSFHNNSWAKRANDIRGMVNSGLKKQHHITVTKLDVNSTIQDINNLANLINNTAVNNRFAIISAEPAMPRIKIRNNSNVSIKVRLKIMFKKTRNANGTGAINRVFLDYFPSQNSPNHNTETVGGVEMYTKIIPSMESWEIDYDSKIRGGDAIIEYIENSNTWSDTAIYKFTFNIRGHNPNAAAVRAYLNTDRIAGNPNSSYLDKYWFIFKMIRQETFEQGGTINHFVNIPNSNTNNPDYNYVFLGDKAGTPVFGPPKGWGLGQIDNLGPIDTSDLAAIGLTQQQFDEIQPEADKEYQTIIDNTGRTIDYQGAIVASDEDVWNWKKNIDKMIIVLGLKVITVSTSITNYATAINNWNSAHPSDQVVFPENQVEGGITFGAIRSSISQFSTNNNLFPATPVNNATYKSFFDAMLIKYYNGNGTEHLYYMYLTSSAGAKPTFDIMHYATRIENGVPKKNYYVRHVSEQDN
jgi:hypothetical protein